MYDFANTEECFLELFIFVCSSEQEREEWIKVKGLFLYAAYSCFRLGIVLFLWVLFYLQDIQEAIDKFQKKNETFRLASKEVNTDDLVL